MLVKSIFKKIGDFIFHKYRSLTVCGFFLLAIFMVVENRATQENWMLFGGASVAVVTLAALVHVDPDSDKFFTRLFRVVLICSPFIIIPFLKPSRSSFISAKCNSNNSVDVKTVADSTIENLKRILQNQDTSFNLNNRELRPVINKLKDSLLQKHSSNIFEEKSNCFLIAKKKSDSLINKSGIIEKLAQQEMLKGELAIQINDVITKNKNLDELFSYYHSLNADVLFVNLDRENFSETLSAYVLRTNAIPIKNIKRLKYNDSEKIIRIYYSRK